MVTLQQHLEMRQKRFNEVAAEIRQRSEAIDKKVGELVGMLAGLKDSESSKRRISEIKGEADDLKRLFGDARRDIAGDFTRTLKL